MLPHYQRYSGGLWVIMFAIVLKEFKLNSLILLIFLIVTILSILYYTNLLSIIIIYK